MEKTASDSWFAKRIMKLTRFEKWFVNNPQRARHVEQTALVLFEHINLPPQPRCLEIGCGQGAVTRFLVERFGAQAVATDFDPEQVTVTQERLADLGERVEFRVVDARAMPFDDTQFAGRVRPAHALPPQSHRGDRGGSAVGGRKRVTRKGFSVN